MEYNNQRLVHVLIVCAFAVAAVHSAGHELERSSGISATKRLILRSRDPLTRRSPDMHFLRFGRSAARIHDGHSASKVNVKREAFDFVDDSTKSHSLSDGVSGSSGIVVSDPNSGRLVLGYNSSPNVGRRFLLATRHRNDNGANADEFEDGYSATDEYSGNDTTGRSGNSMSVEDEDDGSSDDEKHATKHQRYGGRLVASDTFDRLVRGRGNFMRLGRADSGNEVLSDDDEDDRNDSSRDEDADEDDSDSYSPSSASFRSANDDAKRRSANFIRFGRNAPNDESPQQRRCRLGSFVSGGIGEKLKCSGYADHLSADKFKNENAFERYARRRDNFMRLGRNVAAAEWLKLANPTHHQEGQDEGENGNESITGGNGARAPRRSGSFMRLGRADSQLKSYRRDVRRHGNFMRLGRASGGSSLSDGYGNLDSDMFRETRRRDSFLRLGRAASYGGSQITGGSPVAIDDYNVDDAEAHQISDNRTKNAAAAARGSCDNGGDCSGSDRTSSHSTEDRTNGGATTTAAEGHRRYSRFARDVDATIGDQRSPHGSASAENLSTKSAGQPRKSRSPNSRFGRSVASESMVIGESGGDNYRRLSYHPNRNDQNVYRIATTSVKF